MTRFKRENVFERLSRYVYTLILSLFFPLVLFLLRKKLILDEEFSQKRKLSERFGSLNFTPKPQGILVHCVSVGEINAAAGLINKLLNEYPQISITVSTSSTTGAVHAYGLFKDRVHHTFLPIDLPWFMSRFFSVLKPKLVLVTEVEIWPNMLRQCVRRNIPVCLVNARLSDSSFSTYQRLRALFRPALRQFDVIGAQSQASYDNFKSLGVYKQQLKLTLNMKFDIKASEQDAEKAHLFINTYALNGIPVLLAASTHDSEEQFIVEVFQALKLKHPALKLIVVPRHPHRFEEVYQIINAAGLNVIKASDESRSSIEDVLLVDKMGWLKACYQLSDIAFIGGSIAPKGGHNALECALYAKPMMMGSSLYNNPVICDMLVQAGALKIIEQIEQAIQFADMCLSDKALSRKLGGQGLQVIHKNAGALETTFASIKPFL
uniref:3-deoxy-D-manno-octulosonic acid transferase n=1 Tax=Ningiella ruwaisensis TaxID=2364274 RepID=UPI00109FA5C6|nr:3-deoxy-D-manno-octulosonic acid transferase [Ningiella ruwaisensis]